MSSEHAISRTLLEMMSRQTAGRGVFVNGPAWKSRWLPVRALGSNVLCKRHNEALSIFDSRFARFADKVRQLGREIGTKDQTPWLFAIHGHDVERWLLKALCAVTAGGHAARPDGKRYVREVPERWVRILFGAEPMPPTWGLYLDARIGQPLIEPGAQNVSLAPISNIGRVVGIEAHVFGWPLLLAVSSVDLQHARGALTPTSMYRPALVQVPVADGFKQFYFHWEPDDRSPPQIELAGYPVAPG
jgi:hypothetical protein